MTNVDTERRTSDTERPVNPFADARVKSKFFGPTPAGEQWLAEHPEEAKKAEGYVPTTFVPFSLDTIARKKIDDGYEPPKDEPMPTVTNDAPARHLSDAPVPGPVPQGRHQTVTQRVTSFELTSGKLHSGVGVWRVMCHDRNGTHTNEFKEADPICSQLFTRWVPFQRGELVKLDGAWDLTWKNVDGWATAVSFQEVEDVAKPTDAEVRAKAKAVREELEQAYPEMNDGASELDKAFPRDADNTPADPEKPTYLGHTAVPDEAIHAIPNHIKRELALAPEKVGLHVRNALGTATPDYIGKHGVQAAWDKALAYVAKVKAENLSKNGQGAASGEPAAMGIPEKPVAPIPDEKPRSEPANVSPEAKPVETPKAEPTKALASVTSVPVANTGISMLPMVAQWDIMRQQAEVLIKSGFMPSSVNTAEKAIAIMMMGSALQIDPIVALNSINVIQGKPTVSPQLMLALVRRSGQLEYIKITDDGTCCTVEMKRRNEPTHTERFSQQDAAAMGLAGKDNWKKQPTVMRKWRAVSAACRIVFPDVTWGIASYTAEEINPDTAISIDGEIVEVAA